MWRWDPPGPREQRLQTIETSQRMCLIAIETKTLHYQFGTRVESLPNFCHFSQKSSSTCHRCKYNKQVITVGRSSHKHGLDIHNLVSNMVSLCRTYHGKTLAGRSMTKIYQTMWLIGVDMKMLHFGTTLIRYKGWNTAKPLKVIISTCPWLYPNKQLITRRSSLKRGLIYT